MPKVPKVLRDQQVPQVLKVIKVFKVPLVQQDLKASRVLQVLVVQQVVLDQLDLKVLMETLVVPLLITPLVQAQQIVILVRAH